MWLQRRSSYDVIKKAVPKKLMLVVQNHVINLYESYYYAPDEQNRA